MFKLFIYIFLDVKQSEERYSNFAKNSTLVQITDVGKQNSLKSQIEQQFYNILGIILNQTKSININIK